MKIYNEIVTIFNESTGLWETVSEDSYNYNGPMALMQGTLPNNATAISAQDTIADTIKTTTGYFTNGDGTLAADSVYTGSLKAKNEKYYFNVAQNEPTAANVEVQFSVTFGHIAGSGSDQYGDSTSNPANIYGETQAIYKQFTNLLLEETEAIDGFKISAGGSAAKAATRDDYIYVLAGKRARFKDRINKKAWTLLLSGSNSFNTQVAGDAVNLRTSGSMQLSLTDDSAENPATSTPAGPRYNIVSGALGVVSGSGAGYRTYGWFYPEMGLMVFSGAELSASIPGVAQYQGLEVTATASFKAHKSSDNWSSLGGLTGSGGPSSFINTTGFAPNLTAKGDPKNALRFVNCLRLASGNAFRLRAEEDQSQENFFCRIKANQYNFSNNPTFVSGSYNKIRHKDMHGNPTTFISGVGLYNSAGQLLAVAKLSSPLKKNFASEATIKVKLTY